MKPDRWQQIDQILQAALDRDARKRPAFLEQACAGDGSLFGEVESLIKAHEEARSFIEAPLLDGATKIMPDQKKGTVMRLSSNSPKTFADIWKACR